VLVLCLHPAGTLHTGQGREGDFGVATAVREGEAVQKGYKLVLPYVCVQVRVLCLNPAGPAGTLHTGQGRGGDFGVASAVARQGGSANRIVLGVSCCSSVLRLLQMPFTPPKMPQHRCNLTARPYAVKGGLRTDGLPRSSWHLTPSALSATPCRFKANQKPEIVILGQPHTFLTPSLH
jgi:hypothetical protein